MSETVKIWLEKLLNNEIEEEEATIENEKVWRAGSSSDEEREMHQENIDLHSEYFEILNQIKKEYGV